MNDDKHPSLIDQKEWSKSIADALDKRLLTTMIRDLSGVPPAPPYGVGIGSGSIIPPSTPSSVKYVSPEPTKAEIVEQCLNTLLICLPHGYGFIPVLPNLQENQIELAFGKLSHPIKVRVLMTFSTERTRLEFHIVDGRTYRSDEIRFLAMDIVETIKERNGIDDSEQDNKGSD